MPHGDGIVCHPFFSQYHNWNLQALFELQLSEMPASEDLDLIDKLLREGWHRRDGTFATYIEMMPEQPEGWRLDLVERELRILRPDNSLWPARWILLCDRTYMEGPDGPRRGEPLKCGRPIPTLYAGPAATIVDAGTEEEQWAIRDFKLYGVPFETRIPPTRNEEIEIAIDRATEVLLHESNATALELFQKAVETKEWSSMRRPTLRSSIFERIVREARQRAGVPAKRGAPRQK
jgi:hypothetical protein